MIRKVRFPLLAKMIGWLLLHLAVLAGEVAPDALPVDS